MQAIGRCQAEFNGQLVIRAGIEISEPHKHAADVHAVLTNHEWDFVLVSLHWLNSGEVNAINAGKEEFILSTHDWQQSFRDYFTEMATMAREGDFDVLAHIDYPARYNRRYFGNGYDIGLFEDDVRNVLRQVIARGKGIEINTSPWRRGLPDPNPPAKVIHWFREMGGEVLTVGSDAHAPKDVGAGIDRALAIARAAGFTHIATFHNRQVRFERLSSG
jgi:histidinol-phosphatase (PHP family)